MTESVWNAKEPNDLLSFSPITVYSEKESSEVSERIETPISKLCLRLSGAWPLMVISPNIGVTFKEINLGIKFYDFVDFIEQSLILHEMPHFRMGTICS